MSKPKKIEYNNKIKLLKEYKDSFDSNSSSISKKDLLEYILQELKELKKNPNNELKNLTVDELLEMFKSTENTKQNG